MKRLFLSLLVLTGCKDDDESVVIPYPPAFPLKVNVATKVSRVWVRLKDPNKSLVASLIVAAALLAGFAHIELRYRMTDTQTVACVLNTVVLVTILVACCALATAWYS